MSFAIEEILRIEEHAENGLVQVMEAIGATVYKTRDAKIIDTPSVGVKCILGEAQKNREKIFLNPVFQMYDTWLSEIQTTVRTNRTSDQSSPSHVALLGKVRTRMQRTLLVQPRDVWPYGWIEPHILVVDSREQGTIESVEDETDSNVDVTTISWFFMIQVRPTAWPVNPVNV